jgi:spermidine/putrescine transport system ATP-binding protein
MSDRIAIMDKGTIQQLDTPQNIYNHPKTVYVADFIGESNIFNTSINKITKTGIEVSLCNNKFLIETDEKYEKGDSVHILVRPENIKISTNELKNSIKGVITEIIYDGAISKVFVDLDGDVSIKVSTHGVVDYKEQDCVFIKIE